MFERMKFESFNGGRFRHDRQELYTCIGSQRVAPVSSV
jgi:hypothetical protein